MSAKQPILYGGRLSYFTGKARSYLNYRQVAFEEKLATPEIYKTIIMPAVGYPMIPVVVFPDGQVIQDTTELIDHFEQDAGALSVIPTTARQHFVSAMMELYGDEWLVIPAMHYRWAHNRGYAFGEFGKLMLPDASPEEQYKAGEKAAQKFEGSVPFLGANADMADAVEASYVAGLKELDAHFQQHDFLLGAKPCAGDFGLIGPLYAHLYRDPASGEVMKREAPAVARWVERMIAEPFKASGDWLADDAIAPTLIPVLQRQMREQGPCLIDIFDKVAVHKANSDAGKIPRALGMHAFTMEGKTGQRVVLSYTQWMAQRALLPAMQRTGAERAALDQLATDIGASQLLDAGISAPIDRRNHKLVWRAA